MPNKQVDHNSPWANLRGMVKALAYPTASLSGVGSEYGGVCVAHLVDGRVAAGHVVLGNAEDLCDPGEVVAKVVFGLHADHLLKVNQGLRAPNPVKIFLLSCQSDRPSALNTLPQPVHPRHLTIHQEVLHAM